MKAKLWECNNCWKYVIAWIIVKNKWVCNDCVNLPTVDDFKKTVVMPSFVKTVDEVMESIWEPVKRVTILMPPVHTASYLNHTRKIDYKSIMSGKRTIPYGDGYILKEDVINLFVGQLKKTS